MLETTDASPVTKFMCKGPNGTDAQLRLLWELPKGQHSGFRFIVNDGEIDNSTKTCCNHTLSNLRHYTVYQLSVTTLGCGRSSVPRVHECTTGITGMASSLDQNVITMEKLKQSCDTLTSQDLKTTEFSNPVSL